MSTFQLNVEIAPNQLRILKESGFNLCVAKQVNGVYTVVWSGNRDYLSNQTFEWVEEYQVFGVNKFTIGSLTIPSTNAANIQFGQTSTLTNGGVMGDASGTADSSGKFYVKNEFGLTLAGVNGKIGGEFLPVFVTPTVITGTAHFEPVNTIKVWFSLVQKTSTMAFDWDNEGIEVIYSGSDTEKSIKYAGPDDLGEWSVV